MIGSSRTYAIGLAHFQISGGWRSLLLVCAAYLLLVGVVLSIFYYTDRTSAYPIGMTSVAVTMMLIVESIILIFFGSLRVASAIRADISSRMIESHRLMPVPAWRAMAGYLLGSGAHAIVFALLNVALAYVFAMMTGTSLAQVTLNQAILFSFAIFTWTAAALGTLLAKQMYAIGFLAIFLGVCTTGLFWIYMLVPGFALLIGPMIGKTIFNFSPGVRSLAVAYPLSIISQAFFTGLFFAGACRLYRGTVKTAFSIRQSGLLLIVWACVSAAGIAIWQDFGFFNFWDMNTDTTFSYAQVVASLIAAMLVSLVPIHTFLAVQMERPPSFLRTVLFLLMLTAAIAIIPLGDDHTVRVNRTTECISVLTAGAFVVTAFSLLFIFSRIRPLFRVILCLGFGITLWLGPLLLDVLRLAFFPHALDNSGLSVIGMLSPIGLLINTWTMNHSLPPHVPLAFMWGVAALAACIAVMTARGADAPADAIAALATATAPVTVVPTKSSMS